jgi:hypothetical protein
MFFVVTKTAVNKWLNKLNEPDTLLLYKVQ